jgi:rhamnose transport system permease protein
MEVSGWKKLVRFREAGTLALLVLVFGFAGLREPRFLESASINGILLWVPLLVVLGVGQMMVIVTRGIDVSVGSMVGLAAMSVGMLFRGNPNLPVPVGVFAGILVGMVLGSVNGALISWARVPPIIATLGTLSAYRGLVFILSRGQQIDSNQIPDGLTNWSLHGPIEVGGWVVPWLWVIALVLALAGAQFLSRTRAGRDIFAFGSHPEAARLRGVAVGRTLFLVYAVTGALAGLVGSFYASRFGFVNPATAGQGLELVVIAAVVIGGTPVTGGSGTVLGVVLGSLLLAAISNALAVLGIAATWQQFVYGSVILVAVLLETLVRRTVGAKGVVSA